MELVTGIIKLIVIAWLLTQVNRAEISLRSIAKNLEILTQNQRTFFGEKLKEMKLEEPVKIEEEKPYSRTIYKED